MLQQLEFKASTAVRAALSDTGRPEGVRFSPDNRRLALAGYGLNHLPGRLPKLVPPDCWDGRAAAFCGQLVRPRGIEPRFAP
jgi:hypothetical protein